MGLFPAQRHTDGDQIDVAGAAVRLKVSGRARRISLRLDTRRREVVAIAPTLRALPAAAAFAYERADWIAERLAELPAPAPIHPGALIEVLGSPCQLEIGSGRARWRNGEDGQFPALAVAAGDDQAYARAVVRALKARALSVLRERTNIHALTLKQPEPVVAVMDARARWGSCSPPRRIGFAAGAGVGRIRYCWRLVLAPFEVMDYVAAHECAHLIEANHSPRFWAVVHDLVGDHRPHRAWLRANGPRLHGFGG
jgi:predicted metal-dependent hydrolase